MGEMHKGYLLQPKIIIKQLAQARISPILILSWGTLVHNLFFIYLVLIFLEVQGASHVCGIRETAHWYAYAYTLI